MSSRASRFTRSALLLSAALLSLWTVALPSFAGEAVSAPEIAAAPAADPVAPTEAQTPAPSPPPPAAPAASATPSAPKTGKPPSSAAPVAGRRSDGSGSQGLGIDIRLPQGSGGAPDTALAVRVVLGLTLLAVLPALLVCMTAFLRIIIVLSMLRHAIGMPETPPNMVLIGLAMFLTLFTMQPVLQSLNQEAFQPFMQGKLDNEAAYAKASKPLRDFMVRQTREQDLALMVDLSKAQRPQTIDDVSNLQLIPAFMLSELRAAFQIGFVVFLPFLLIDLIVSSILMALGMMMMPPVTVALPLKVLMFVLVDGWSLILRALVGSFH